MSPQEMRTRNGTHFLGGYTQNGPVNQSANVSKNKLSKLQKNASGVHLPNLGRTVSHSLTPNMHEPQTLNAVA